MDALFNINIKSKELYINDKYIDSIVISFDSFITTVTPNDRFMLYKYKINENEFNPDEYSKNNGLIMQYIDDDLYMAKSLYIGGYNMDNIYPEKIDITNNIAMGARSIIDTNVEEGYTYIYLCLYNYGGTNGMFSIYTNLSMKNKNNDNFNYTKITIRNRNRLRRSPISSKRTWYDNIEIEQSFNSLYNIINDFETTLVFLKQSSNSLNDIYDIEEQVNILLTTLHAFGYGIGKYGRDGVYGISDDYQN